MFKRLTTQKGVPVDRNHTQITMVIETKWSIAYNRPASSITVLIELILK